MYSLSFIMNSSSMRRRSSTRKGEAIQKSRNSGRSRGHTSSLNTNNFVTKREVRGGKLELSTNPPEVTYQPWMPLTVVHSGQSGEITMRVRDLCKQIANQIDPTGHGLKSYPEKWSANECIMQLRIRSVRVWNVTGRMIAISVDDFSDANKAIADVDTLCGLVDTGSNLHVPAVGYQLPISHQNIVLRNDVLTSNTIIYHVNCPSSDVCIIYTNLYFRFDGPAKFSSFNDTMFKLITRIRTETVRIQANVEDIGKNVNEIKDHDRGTIGNAIVRGVEIAAPYVLPAVAAADEERLGRIESMLRTLTVTSAYSSPYSEIGVDDPTEDM
nr:MAG: hypothetical protein [Chaq virus]